MEEGARTAGGWAALREHAHRSSRPSAQEGLAHRRFLIALHAVPCEPAAIKWLLTCLNRFDKALITRADAETQRLRRLELLSALDMVAAGVGEPLAKAAGGGVRA